MASGRQIGVRFRPMKSLGLLSPSISKRLSRASFQETIWQLLSGMQYSAHFMSCEKAYLLSLSDGKMFYGIYADSNGDSPEVIGEASWLMARTCFPSENLNGGIGHTGVDVTCKFFKLP